MLNNIIIGISNFTQIWYDIIISEILFTTILFILLFPITLVLKNKSPYWKFGLWSLLFIRLILPPALDLPGNIWSNLSNLHLFSWLPIETTSNPYLNFEENLSTHSLVSNNSSSSLEKSFTSLNSDQIIRLSLFIVWMIGFIGLLIIFYRKKQYFYKIIQHANQIEDLWIGVMYQNWKEKYKIRRKIDFYTSDKYLSPFTIGIFRPKIYIPLALIDSNNKTALEAIIGHELAHVKRHDALGTQFQFIIQAIYFFYPIVWLAGRNINESRERLCDRLVLQQKQILPRQYAQSLIQIVQFNTMNSLAWPYAPAFKGDKMKLRLRINQILENNIMNKKQVIMISASILVFSIVTLPMASILKSNQSETNQPVYPKKHSKKVEFVSPMQTGKISSGFGNRMHPIKKVLMHHNGIDIAAPLGTEVYAIAEGIVDFADYKDAWGNKIVLVHENGFSSIYGQLSKILVKKGERVKVGDLIGLVGNSGQSTAPHLHFEIRENNEPLDPEEIIDFSTIHSTE